MSTKDKLILVTNDDGIYSRGITALAESVMPFGEIVVVAPPDSESGMSQAITVKHPLRVRKAQLNGYTGYIVNGTPTDCVKLAFNKLLPRKPDLLVSGINHGSNSSTSVLYSGTLGAALEGSLNGIPSIGFSTINYDPDADLTIPRKYAEIITSMVIENGLPPRVCLNVNFPANTGEEPKGIKICRQTIGYWREEFDQRKDPVGRDYYWLTGEFFNTEPEAEDTDEWALKNNYISIVPLTIDLTSYNALDIIKNWKFQ